MRLISNEDAIFALMMYRYRTGTCKDGKWGEGFKL